MIKAPIRINAEFDDNDNGVLFIDGTQLKEIIARTVDQILEKRESLYRLELRSEKAIKKIH
jgi:hypothetical protein